MIKGYKKCLDETKTKFVLVELEISTDAQWFTPKMLEAGCDTPNEPPKSRCNTAKCVKIHGGGKVAYSLHDPNFSYEVGKTLVPDKFDPIDDYACSNGIHFFLDRKDAIEYGIGSTLHKGAPYPSTFSSENWLTVTNAIVDEEQKKEEENGKGN